MSASPDTPPRHPREARRQARSFERVRQAHQSEVAEDHVKLIADLIDVTGEARAVALGERLGVDPETAEIDAESIEHHTSEKTLAALRRVLER